MVFGISLRRTLAALQRQNHGGHERFARHGTLPYRDRRGDRTQLHVGVVFQAAEYLERRCWPLGRCSLLAGVSFCRLRNDRRLLNETVATRLHRHGPRVRCIWRRWTPAWRVAKAGVKMSILTPNHSFGGAGMALTPTRARYSSACNRSLPARSRIFRRLSIEETSSSCSVRNHCKKLIVM